MTKLNRAKEAIDAVFSDTSKPAEKTLEDLQDLRDEIEIKIGCIETDLRRARRESEKAAK